MSPARDSTRLGKLTRQPPAAGIGTIGKRTYGIKFLMACAVVVTSHLVACSGGSSGNDDLPGSEADAAPTDAAPTDAAPTDAAPTDAAPTDAAPTDAAPTDAAPTGGIGGTPTPSCNKSDDEVGTFNLTMDVAGEARVYRVIVPSGYTGTKDIPLVIMLHGVGVTIQATHEYFGQHMANAVGDAGISVYMEAAASNNRRWQNGLDSVDVQFFDEVLVELLAKYCIDPKKVFVTGFSNGAFMTNRLRCDRADVIRAVGPVAGGEGGSNCPAVPAYVVHATNDGQVVFSAGESTRDALIQSNGCSGTTTPLQVDGCLPSNNCSCVEYDDCTDGRLKWCQHEQDHHYDAWHARAIWQFFSEFQ